VDSQKVETSMKSSLVLLLCILFSLALIGCNRTAEIPESTKPVIVFITVTPQPSATPWPSPTPPAAITEQLMLRDIATEVGLNFQHGAFKESIDMDPVAMMGGGLCWLDFDNDGWLDLYVVNSYSLRGYPAMPCFTTRGVAHFPM
jgi:hypothetical protein